MDNNEAMARLTAVFRRIFGDETLNLTPTTTAKDVPGWDSLMHINLIVAVESEFKIHFTSREIAKLQDVGALAELVGRKQAS